jgi:GT2 family glycosyltransferase
MIPIIIPYYKAKEKLLKCLAAINNQDYKSVEIFVRDNSEDNILYTAAINEGFKKFAFREDIKYVLVLSQDAYLKADTLSHLIEAMESRPECGIACPIQISEQSGQVTYGGGLDSFPEGIHRVGAVNLFDSDFNTYWANGAAMLIRTSLIKEIGLFDKNMRFVCSDSDYSFTARSRGWQVWVVAKAHVFHAPNSSLQTQNLALEKIKVQDWIYFGNKWLSGDLYKSLSHEGEKFTKMKVKWALETFQNQLRKFQ